MSREPLLDTRTLNRTLLGRQDLLERRHVGAAELISGLVGMQAQEPPDPYVGLWSRTADYDPGDLATLMRERAAVRGTLMRGTIHLATTADYLWMRTTLGPMIERMFHSGTPFSRALGDVDFDEIVAAGSELLEREPRTRAELSRLLGERWPERDATALGMAAVFLQPTVQVTPRGVWGQRKQATWALADRWIGRSPAKRPAVEKLITRYLAAFGPASVADIRAWCGMAGMRELVEPLRPKLRTYRDEHGSELLDLPDAPIAERDRPAPVRFLPTYDNVTLGHADRTRVVPNVEQPPPLFPGSAGATGGLLVDGFWRGLWKRDAEGETAVLRVEVIKRLSKRDAASVTAEGRRLLELLAPGQTERDVRITTPS